MTVIEFVEKNKDDFSIIAGENGKDNNISNVYIGDLLSWVMGRAKEDCAWITIQGHINIVAVASLINASCIIIAESAEATEDTIEKANKEEIPIIQTKYTHYQIAKKLFNEGI